MAANINAIVDSLSGLTVMEMSQLVKELERVFGVSAAALSVAAAPQVAPSEAPVAEKTDFKVVLTGVGGTKMAVIKTIREIVSDLTLVQAKNLVDSVPQTVRESVNKDEADAIKAKLEAVGATVELQ